MDNMEIIDTLDKTTNATLLGEVNNHESESAITPEEERALAEELLLDDYDEASAGSFFFNFSLPTIPLRTLPPPSLH